MGAKVRSAPSRGGQCRVTRFISPLPLPLPSAPCLRQGAAEIIARGKDKETATQEYEEKFANPIQAAERGFIDAVLRPNETRRVICEDLELFEHKKLDNPWKKHANMPL